MNSPIPLDQQSWSGLSELPQLFQHIHPSIHTFTRTDPNSSRTHTESVSIRSRIQTMHPYAHAYRPKPIQNPYRICTHTSTHTDYTPIRTRRISRKTEYLQQGFSRTRPIIAIQLNCGKLASPGRPIRSLVRLAPLRL